MVFKQLGSQKGKLDYFILCFLLVPLYTSIRSSSKVTCAKPLIIVVLLVRFPENDAILHKRANQRTVSSLLMLLWSALHVATQKRKLGVSLVCHGYNMFWPLQVGFESYPQVLSVHDFFQYLFCQWVVEKFKVAWPWHSHSIALGIGKTHTPCVTPVLKQIYVFLQSNLVLFIF